jgi:putative ABC transport system permease protein
MLIALRNLFKDKLRLALSIGGVALAVMLILILNGFLTGLTMQIGAYLTHEPGTLVVAQGGVEDMIGVSSQLPAGAAEMVRARGAKRVIPILSQSVIFEMHGRKQLAYIIGYDPQTGGGPWQLSAGREPRNDKEIIFDRILAQRHEVGLGDKLELMDEDFTIVGLSEGTNSWMTGFLFVRKSALETLLRAPGATSFLLVTPAQNIGTDQLHERLNGLSGTNVLTKNQIIANDVKLFGKAFAAPMQFMAAIAFLVGALVVGLVIYTATIERQREYGVLKAIGAPNGMLYRVVTLQALIAAGAGSALGVAFAYGAAGLIMDLRPQFLIVYEPEMLAQSLVAGVAMALVAALAPARVVARLEPAQVFRK